MILATAKSKNGVLIRLTNERFGHITYSHKEISILDYKKIIDVVENPVVIFEGNFGELLASAKYGKDKWLVVVYKEIGSDGFVITTYITTDIKWLFKRKIIWTNKL